MNKIKKIFLIVSLMSLASGFIFAQNDLPAFENGNGLVIDASAVEGKFKSHLIIINKNDANPIDVKVFVYENDDWKEIGNTVFNFFDDEYKIKSGKEIKPSNYRFFAIELSKDVKASCRAEKNHNDLVIEIRNEGSDLSKPAIPGYTGNPEAFLFDLYAVDDGEEADENMKLKGKFATKQKVGFSVFAYDKKNHEWIEFGTSYIERKNDSDSVEGKNNDLKKYRYFAIESMDGNEYHYEPEEDDDDLIVVVTLP